MINKSTTTKAPIPQDKGFFISNFEIKAYNNPNKAMIIAEITLLKTGSFHILRAFSLKPIIKLVVNH